MANLGNQSENRIRVDLDEKMQTPILQLSNIRPPEGVGIFDEPTRCYKINLQWAKILEGWIDWLTGPAFWVDAQDDDYIGCVEFRRFLVGENCYDMCFDCEQLKACFPSIQEIQTLINFTSYQINTDAGINVVTYTTNDGDVIINWNQANFNLPSAPFTEDQSDDITTENDGFNCDRAYGAARAIRDYLNAISEDFIGQLRIYQNPLDLFNQFLSIIPLAGVGVDVLGIDNIINLISSYIELPLESYNASYNQALIEQIACELLCEFSAEQKITLDIVRRWLKQKVGLTATSIGDVLGLTNAITSQTWVGDEVVYIFWYGLLEGSAYLGTLNPTNYESVDKANLQLRLGQANPSNDWTILCAACNEWAQNMDFSTPSTYDPAWINIVHGVVGSGGIQSVEWVDGSNIRRRGVEVEIQWQSEMNYQSVLDAFTVSYNIDGNIGGGQFLQGVLIVLERNDGSTITYVPSNTLPVGGKTVWSFGDTIPINVSSGVIQNGQDVFIDLIRIRVVIASGPDTGIASQFDATMILQSFTARGTQTNPFTLEGQPC